MDRAKGALVGLALGDALGTTLEFAGRDTKPTVTDLVGGGPFRLAAGEWTDDTSTALCLADSLLERGQLDVRDLMERFLRWYDEGHNSVTGECFDIGVTTARALQTFRDTGEPLSGSTDPQSAGNGSVMRLAPVAIRWWHDRSEARAAARLQSRTTHGAVQAVEACALFAELLIEAIAGAPKGDRPARQRLERRRSDRRGGRGGVARQGAQRHLFVRIRSAHARSGAVVRGQIRIDRRCPDSGRQSRR